jgi:23S rRNA (uracil-5-)-methyltransferase RumA
MKENETYEARVIGVNNFGNGICRVNCTNKFVPANVFVPATYAGDVVKLKITDVTSSHIMGEVTEFIEKSPNRIAPDCPVFFACGGCDFRDITYAHELEIKKSFVVSALTRNGLLRDGSTSVTDTVSSGEICGYRSKMIVRTDAGGRGYYKKSSYETAHHDRCLLHPQKCDEIADETYRALAKLGVPMYDEKSHTGTARGIYIREAKSTGEIMLCVIVRVRFTQAEADFAAEIAAKFPEIKSIFVNVNDRRTNVALGESFTKIHSGDYIEDVICGLRFRISPQSFYQVNHDGAEILYNLALDAAAGGSDVAEPKLIADLYCGTGTMGIMCASRFPNSRVVGIEIVKDAVADAVHNAEMNGLTNIDFICGDAETFRESADAIIIDPPRKGCSAGMINQLLALSPKRIVYVSCNPETMARDAKKLCADGGYTLESVTPVDLFPRTLHVECVAVLGK